MKKIEADKKVKLLNQVDPEWFCPLIKDTCNKKCLCYFAAYVWTETPNEHNGLADATRDDFKVCEPFCGNMMFCETDLVCPHN